MSGFVIALEYVHPQGFWTVTTSTGHRGAGDARTERMSGLYTSAEAALAACWLTVDERIELPAISTYAQVRELLDRRLGIPDPEDAVTIEPMDAKA